MKKNILLQLVTEQTTLKLFLWHHDYEANFWRSWATFNWPQDVGYNRYYKHKDVSSTQLPQLNTDKKPII